MFRFKLIAGLVSLVVLGLVLIVVASPPAPVEADDAIETKFALVQNTLFTPITGASGTGQFRLDGEDLEFRVKFKADGLLSNTEYKLAVTVRNVTGGDFGGAVLTSPVATVIVGTATTDDEGRLKFKGEDVLPASAFTTGTEWRIDQQVRLAGGGGGTAGVCVECILVCSPATKVKVAGLVQVP